MVKKIRRITVTVRSREIAIVRNSPAQTAAEVIGAETTICPVCHSPLAALPPASSERALGSGDFAADRQGNLAAEKDQ